MRVGMEMVVVVVRVRVIRVRVRVRFRDVSLGVRPYVFGDGDS